MLENNRFRLVDQVGTGTMIIELTLLKFRWSCQLELSLANFKLRPNGGEKTQKPAAFSLNITLVSTINGALNHISSESNSKTKWKWKIHKNILATFALLF
jgi:hypothetical protein